MMVNALLVSHPSKMSQVITETLRQMDYDRVDTAPSCAEGRRRVQMSDYELLVVNTPLHDEVGYDMVIDVDEVSDVGIIVLVKSSEADEAEEVLTDTSAFVLTKPLTVSALRQSVRFLSQSREKITALQQKNDKLRNKLDDMKIVYRGKLYLMGRYDMTESQAHRYIQKKAMDLRETPAAVAERIISTISHDS